MKKILIPFITLTIAISSHAQIKVPKIDANTLSKSSATGLSNEDIVGGLKEALDKGAQCAVDSASQTNGFYKNEALYIATPDEAQKAKDYAIKAGMQGKVDEFEKSMNRAAEEASKTAAPILLHSIKNMSVKDGYEILKGKDNAATRYLKKSTKDSLTTVFNPIVKKAMEKVQVAKYWSPIMTSYNKTTRFSGQKKIDPDLEAYITKKTLKGLFKLIAKEEKKIRKDPAARSTELLQSVFGEQD